MIDFNNIVNEIKDEIISIRRTIHKNPELAFLEENTARTITSFFEKHGIKSSQNIAKTGVLAQIDGKNEGPTILFRADMDALSIQEETNLPYKSQIKGQMHACGHDIHVAVLLGAAYVINKMKDKFHGNVRFAFQPAEEATGGAQMMIDEGALDGVDMAFAAHVCPETETGKISVKSGEFYAIPDHFNVTIKGKGAHGALPHQAIDPILISANIISSLQSIVSRKIDPLSPGVLSICYINSGSSENIIPDNADFGGTFRTFDLNTRFLVRDLIESHIKNICDIYGATYDFNYKFLYPPLINDKNATEKVILSAKEVLGEESVTILNKPSMLGEDFSYFANKVPSCYFRIGCKNDEKISSNSLHTSTFNPNENSIEHGIKIFAHLAKTILKPVF